MLKNNIYYVYIYLDQRKSGKWIYNELEFNFEPFYIGKGHGDRVQQHFRPSMLKKNNLKTSKINSIIGELGEYPLHYRVYTNLEEKEAFLIEKNMICHFGRLDQKSGILTNLSDGGEGASGALSQKRWESIKKIRKKLYQYSLDGNFIKEWESGLLVKKTFNTTASFSEIAKRDGSCCGYVWTYEYKGDKITPRKKGQMMNSKVGEINQIDMKTNQIIKKYKTIKMAIQELGGSKIEYQQIVRCIKGKAKQSMGFRWEKVNNE